jgi:SAM-dependent methyltransferase
LDFKSEANEYDNCYQQDAWFGSRESHLLDRYGEILKPGARVLDVGVGQGRNALPLARNGCRVTGLDNSEVAIKTVQEAAGRENLDLVLRQTPFLDFPTTEPFDAVLCFGLLQILSPQDSASLLERIHHWLRPGGTLFMTAWHVDDPSFPGLCDSWERLGLYRFRSPDKTRYRTFLGRGEILQLFFRWKVVHHWEGLGQAHRHGDSPLERHGDVEVVLTKP